MEIRSEAEIQEKVLKNQRLVHHLLKKKKINPCDYDDLLQIGTIGLTKAVMTFDETRQVKFGTYAARCIENEINMYFRKNKNDMRNVSLNEPLNEDGSGNVLTLEDVLFDESESNFTEIFQHREMLEKIIRMILNCFSARDRNIFLFSIGGSLQRELANKFNISQSYISRIQKKLRKCIRKYIETNKYIPNKPFSITMKDNWFKICFLTADIEELSQALENFAMDTEVMEFFNVKVECDKIEMYFLADPKSFNLIAQILQEMENAGVEVEY